MKFSGSGGRHVVHVSADIFSLLNVNVCVCVCVLCFVWLCAWVVLGVCVLCLARVGLLHTMSLFVHDGHMNLVIPRNDLMQQSGAGVWWWWWWCVCVCVCVCACDRARARAFLNGGPAQALCDEV